MSLSRLSLALVLSTQNKQEKYTCTAYWYCNLHYADKWLQ